MVIRHCFKAGIPIRGLLHDLSKYSPTEFIPGAKYYTGTKSPNEGERDEYGYSRAWLHHKGRNRHHFEYWNDYNKIEKRVMPVKMPLKFAVEMICDRVAASKTYQGENYTDSHPLEYYERGNAKNIMHPETSAKLKELLIILNEKGEKEAFRAVKRLVKEKTY